MLYLFSISYYT